MYPEESGWKTYNIDGRLFKIDNETNIQKKIIYSEALKIKDSKLN